MALFFGVISCGAPQIYSKNFIEKTFKEIRRVREKVRKSVFFHNFHQVDELVFRSAQLSGKALDHYIRKYNIKTIINLRGENRDKKWWQEEHRIAYIHGVKHINISMNSKTLPSKENLKLLLDAFKEIYKNKGITFHERRVLIHCAGGADRTSEAAALWVYNRTKNSDAALNQLRLKYRHNRHSKPAKVRFIRIWIKLMQENNFCIKTAFKKYNPKKI